ncbi:ABC transporter permease [Oscillospiraceae bacterium 21-37]|uniref:ABC transporter permease n=1 Tax=Eubacteriales TaxID=186802 RepID=UPI001370CA41|nr:MULTISPECIES: ABC transporter permease [unclassified Neglectibacter]MCI8920365.1 ABC transporter permease [Acutalibacter sp.]MCI9116116.1 ABC transporter permease [Acutalibacter sp.]NBI19227.1 ABC transporter permease [Neglectibacter sp. 59]NBJ74903.1 ABC transporter permease [Neglectibacter sp. X4]NCE82721.1 ABC transporter permease [Neglectibacter sp. X58]
MKGFMKYYGKRIVWYVITLVVAVFLNFLLPRLMPGDPVKALAVQATQGVTDPSVQQKMIEQYSKEFGLDKSLPEQFFVYVGKLFQGDMGNSLSQYPRTVNDIIGSSVVWTLGLQIPAIIVGWFLGNLLGAIAAYIRKAVDAAVLPLFMFISNFPAFGLAFIMIYVFSSVLKIAPTGGGYSFDMNPSMSWEFFASVLRHYQLPFWTAVLITIGGQAIGMRSMSIYELNADYVKYSRFLGIKDWKIVLYVFRNAMLPQITGLALSFGTMIGGNLVAEIVYNYPGLGTAMFGAIGARDYPLLSGCTLVITIMVLIANLVVEILYGIIDPRVKAAQMEAE